jgi:prepilin-type N-terminal cleavage/methylation domain-containing protein
MPRLNKKTGFTVIEVLCAVSIMSILSLFILTVQLSNLNLTKYNNEKVRYITALEAIKQELLSNATYNDVVTLNNENRRFIGKDNLSIRVLRTISINELFTETCDFNNTYMLFQAIPGEVLKIQLELHLKFQQKEEIIKYEFYKGNYI